MSKEVLKNIKEFFNKLWYFLWKDDSLKGWIFSIIFIFIIVKFVFFPSLSLITGTELPLAIVESCSMYHEGGIFSNLDNWWEDQKTRYSRFDITKEDFQNFHFRKGLDKGDILFITGVSPENIKLGDVIVFEANQRHPLIHRVVTIEERDGERFFSTMGDNNNRQLMYEVNIKEDQILGKARFKISPYIGWIKLAFFESQRPSQERGFCEGI